MSFDLNEFEDKDQYDFEMFMSRFRDEFKRFDKIGEFTYSDSHTSIAYNCYLKGKQSQQSKIDELQKRIDEALEMLEYNEYVDSAHQAIYILKGEK